VGLDVFCCEMSNEKHARNNLRADNPRILANAEVITDGQNRSPGLARFDNAGIKTPGRDIGSTQDQAVEAQENMSPPVRR
jgi:hypothetical protein